MPRKRSPAQRLAEFTIGQDGWGDQRPPVEYDADPAGHNLHPH